jgi:hypothetical protein
MQTIARKVRVRLAVSLALILGSAGALEAQNTFTIGGSGGTSYTLACKDDEVLVGIRTASGSWIDRISAVCARASLACCGWSNAYTTENAGKEHLGNTYDGRVCPAGYAVKSFHGTAGWYTNSISLTCHKLGSGARTQSTSSRLSSIGNVNGSVLGPHTCGEAKPARGIRGKAGEYVDSFGLTCGYILPTVPVLLVPVNGSDVTTKRPLFDWDPIDRIQGMIKVCLNLSTSAECSISGTVKAEVHPLTTSWRPSEDLPFTRGDKVYWRVEACNDNGCKHTVRSFRFMP